MITILWLIRSNQGITEKGGVTAWQEDWFLSSLFTLVIILADIMLIGFILSTIHIINIWKIK